MSVCVNARSRENEQEMSELKKNKKRRHIQDEGHVSEPILAKAKERKKRELRRRREGE